MDFDKCWSINKHCTVPTRIPLGVGTDSPNWNFVQYLRLFLCNGILEATLSKELNHLDENLHPNREPQKLEKFQDFGQLNYLSSLPFVKKLWHFC